MRIPFSANHQFGEKIVLSDGSTAEGLRIPFSDHKLEYPIVHVYCHIGNNEYRKDLVQVLLLSNNDIFIVSDPFVGIAIIK